MSGRIIAQGTYRGKDGKERRFTIGFNGRRKSGLMEWCRKALANQGTATKADGALWVTFKENK